jgi:hypothetical protein
MMKYFFSLLLVVVLATSAYAADAKVWFTPMPGKEPVSLTTGDPILIYAKLDNVLKDPVTYVLAFTVGEKTIGSKVVTLAGYTAQDTSVEWKMPETSTDVLVTVAKATDKNKKELKALAGPIGTVTVGVPVATTQLDLGPVKGWVGDLVSALEAWRVKQSEYFTALKDEAKEVLSRTTIKDVGDLLQPETPTQSATDANPQVEQKDNGTTLGYLKLIYATAGKAFFGHKGVYFVTIILAALLLIRLFLKLLFR